jgi:hypothetical protein
MKVDDWRFIKVISDLTKTSKLKVGDVFLAGPNIIDQKGKKKIGDEITYYKVLKNENNKIEYMIKIDTLRR